MNKPLKLWTLSALFASNLTLLIVSITSWFNGGAGTVNAVTYNEAPFEITIMISAFFGFYYIIKEEFEEG
jgi:hypothetical protein